MTAQNASRQSLQSLQVAIGEGVRQRGKDLENTNHFLADLQRHDQDRADPEQATRCRIHPRIDHRVIATLGFSGPQADGRQSRLLVELGAKLGGASTGSGATYHLAVLEQGNGRSGSCGCQARLPDDLVKDEVQSQVG